MEKQIKLVYEKPQVILERELEALAVTCDATYSGFATCQKDGSCTTLQS